ncbi:MAG: hypothetical protein ACPG05_00440 [Bdellovibrionales bacterium]
MSDDQDLNRHVESVLEECRAWYEELILSLVLQEEKDEYLFQPQNMNSMLNLMAEKGMGLSAQSISTNYEELGQVLKKLSSFHASSSEDKKSLTQSVIDSYGRLTQSLRSSISAGDAMDIDPATGLTLEGKLEKDYKIEMERLERDGQAFTLCLVRSDLIWHNESNDPDRDFAETSKLILSNLRLFDEAYKLDGNYIMVFLKQTGSSGGVKFYERTQRQFDKKRSEEGLKLSITACLTEPVRGQKLNELIPDMKKDLDNTCKNVRDDYIVMTEATDLQKFLNLKK